MLDYKRAVKAAGTMATALLIGFVMQNGMAKKSSAAAPQNVVSAEDSALMDLQDVTLTAAPQSINGASVLPSVAQHETASASASIDEFPKEESAPSFNCEASMSGEAMSAALVRVTVVAPCMKNERFTLHHNGLMITLVTDDDGNARSFVPALAQSAVFIAAFASGEGAVASVEVADIAEYDRVVVQWKGQSGLQIHALEFGADYESSGHVWEKAARDSFTASKGEGGFVTRHGGLESTDGMMAEVYTFPTGKSARTGTVELSVEANINAQTCGRDIEAQSLQISQGGAPKVQEIVLSMPDCDASDDILVLNNLLNDLTIAAK